MHADRFTLITIAALTEPCPAVPTCGCGNELHTYDTDVCADCAVAEMEQDERLARAEAARATNEARASLARAERAADALTRTLLAITGRAPHEPLAALWHLVDRAALRMVPAMLRAEGFEDCSAMLTACDPTVHGRSGARATRTFDAVRELVRRQVGSIELHAALTDAREALFFVCVAEESEPPLRGVYVRLALRCCAGVDAAAAKRAVRDPFELPAQAA